MQLLCSLYAVVEIGGQFMDELTVIGEEHLLAMISRIPQIL